MECSPARLEANRRNAQLSTGPRTEEGKERSRANAYKHGMAGSGVVLPAEDRARVDGLAREFESQFRASTDHGRGLARRAAVLAVRLDRSADQESAATAARVACAAGDFDEARMAEAEGWMAGLGDDPAASVRQLRRTPEGIDRLLEAWRALLSDLTFEAEARWDDRHRVLAERLSGRQAGAIGLSRVEALDRAIRGDFTHLGPDDGAGLDADRRSAWARGRMAELIGREIAGLVALRASVDLDLIARLRGLAPTIALFDPSKPAQLARRYEAEAAREFHRTLRELREGTRAEPAPNRDRAPEPVAASPVARAEADLVASIRAVESASLIRPVEAPRRRPDPASLRAKQGSRRDQRPAETPRNPSAIVVGLG